MSKPKDPEYYIKWRERNATYQKAWRDKNYVEQVKIEEAKVVYLPFAYDVPSEVL